MTTNREWLNGLAHEDPHALTEWLDAEHVDVERKCPGYDPENHYCRYHDIDFELTRENVCKLKRENAELQAKLEDAEFERDALRDKLEDDWKYSNLKKQVDLLVEQRDRWRGNWQARNESYSELASEYDELEAENAKLRGEVIQYARDCGECGTAMPKGISWPRYDDGSLVELPCKMMYMGNMERLQGVRFYDSCFVLEFTGVDHCKESYGLPYDHVFSRYDDEKDEGLA